MIYLFLIYRVYIFITTVAGYVNLKFLKKANIDSDHQLKNQYILIFPAYNEQQITNETCKYFEKWLQNDSTLEMILVGDINEKNFPTTVDIAKEYFLHSNYKYQFKTLVCDRKKGSKASKINFAINHLKKTNAKLPHLVIFDFDARPKWKDFVKADMLISQSNGQIYSFVPIVSTYNNLGIILKAYVINHLERILGNELGNNILPTYLRYPMGATMVLDPTLWNKVEQIPEPIDDLPLGYLLAKKDAKCITLPFFTSVQAPPNIISLYRQYIPIYTGVFSRLSTLKQFNIPINIKDYVIEILCNIFTIFEFIAIAYSIVLLYYFNFIGVTALLIQVFINLIFFDQLSFRNLILGFIGYFIRLSLFLNFLITKSFTQVDLSKYKTPRK